MSTIRIDHFVRRRLLAGCAALAAGGGLAYGLTVTSAGRAGTVSQLTHVVTAGSGAFSKTVTQVVTVEAPGVTGVNSLAAPPAAPAQMLAGTAEVPISPSVLSYTNGWTVSDGPVQMSVFAGSEASNPATGLLVITTNNLGDQSTRVVKLAGVGAVTITGSTPGTTTAASVAPPNQTRAAVNAEKVAPAARPQSFAETGKLKFTSASGTSGSLNLQTATASTK
jgi:hypothetical protein